MSFFRKLVPAALAALLLAVSAGAPARATERLFTGKLQTLYLTAFDEALNKHAFLQSDGTTYVSTGDIAAEWLRDASAVMEPYVGQARTDGDIAATIRGVIAREAKYILVDPYANAFTPNYKVAERKFEVDSLLYPIWFADRYATETGDKSIYTPEFQRAMQRVLVTLRTEQHHDTRSAYRHADLANGGKGSWVKFTGMIWTGFRPSDDPARYQYNVPDNMFAVVVLQRLAAIERYVYRDKRDADNAYGLALDVRRGLARYAKRYEPGIGTIYAYEVDGYGHANLMDDANVPSLLSASYLGFCASDDPVYKATRAFVLSSQNPYFYRGKYASGIGSPHTPKNYVWPLGLIMQALTSTDPEEIARVVGYIGVSDVGDHRLHESFNANWPETYTRGDFAWPNALYGELVARERRDQISAR